MSTLLANEVSCGIVINQKLISRNKSTGDARQKTLRKNTQERAGQLNADLGLLVGRKSVNNAVHRLTGGAGVQSREHQVSGFSGSDRGGDSLRIAHLADHHNIGILPKNTTESGVEVWGIKFNLALINDGFLGFENIFNRILDGNDMFESFQVDGLYHGGESGGFAHSDRTHYQEKALLPPGKGLKH